MPGTDKNTAARSCLVTGGFGYAGAWIAEHLAATGHEVFILSRRAAAPSPGLPCTLISADIGEISPEALSRLLPDNLDSVVHAASVNEEFLPNYPANALKVNAFGTRVLLESLRLFSERNAVPPPLLLYMSTFHVYGRSEGRINEELPAAPRGDYAITHFFAEEYCRMFMRAHACPSIVVRLTNGYGRPRLPGSDKWHLLINDLCKSAVTHGRIELRSNPDIPRDFIWLGDVARAVERLLHAPGAAGKLFNLSSGKSITIGEAAARVLQVYNATTVSRASLSVPPAGQFTNTPRRKLYVDNSAVAAATGISFTDRMDEEIAAIIKSLAEGSAT